MPRVLHEPKILLMTKGYCENSRPRNTGNVAAHLSSQADRLLPIAERRARFRALVTPPIYVNLDNLNGGLVFNISRKTDCPDGCLGSGCVGFLTSDSVAGFRRLDRGKRRDSVGRAIQRKEGEVRFVGLAGEARRRINIGSRRKGRTGRFSGEERRGRRIPWFVRKDSTRE